MEEAITKRNFVFHLLENTHALARALARALGVSLSFCQLNIVKNWNPNPAALWEVDLAGQPGCACYCSVHPCHLIASLTGEFPSQPLLSWKEWRSSTIIKLKKTGNFICLKFYFAWNMSSKSKMWKHKAESKPAAQPVWITHLSGVWEMNCRCCWGNSCLSQSSHLASPAD